MTRRSTLLGALMALAAGSAHADGATVYKRCAACHLQSGKGVPGAFPPLAEHAAQLAVSPAGRTYLVLAAARGVSGPLDINGAAYRGFMPAQSGLSAADLADVLNYAGRSLGGGQAKAFKSFTAAEVDGTLKKYPSATPQEVAALRPKRGGAASAR